MKLAPTAAQCAAVATAVVSALSANSSSAQASKACCQLLGLLASKEEHRPAIVRAGGEAALEAALAAHGGNAAIATAATSALAAVRG